jgi:hypothetical protein
LEIYVGFQMKQIGQESVSCHFIRLSSQIGLPSDV